MSERGRVALPEVQGGSADRLEGPGGVGRLSRKSGRDREDLAEVREALKEVREVLGGPTEGSGDRPEGPGGVERPSRRSGWPSQRSEGHSWRSRRPFWRFGRGREALSEFWEGSKGHSGGPGGVSRPYRRSRSGR